MTHYYNIPERVMFYCPQVDGQEPDYDGEEQLDVVTDPQKANLVSSMVKGVELHAPVLDFDFPIEVLPSSQLGRYHLYIHRQLTWASYTKIISAMWEGGLLEQGYTDASLTKGFTAVRPPWVKKINAPRGVEVLKENSMLRRENFQLRNERDYLLERVAQLESSNAS